MIDLKALLLRLTKTYTTTLTSSNWTATNASFSEGYSRQYGGVRLIYMTLSATAAMTAGTEYTLGTLGVHRLNGAVCSCGTGVVSSTSGGQVRIRPTVAIASGANIYIRIITLD